MGTALVPAFPSDADIINDIEMRPRVRLMHIQVLWRQQCDALSRAFRQCDALSRAFRQMSEQITQVFNLCGNLVRDWQWAGILPPDPHTLKHGTVWTSPIDGTQMRVRGRRGRPQTFHWGLP